MSASVFIGDVIVGQLIPDASTQSTAFEFDPAYANDGARPVLGRWFEDRSIEAGRRFAGSPMPSYFRNLLPEGALRKIVEARIGASALPEYAMLLRLGEHLPGAVRVIGDEWDPDTLLAAEQRSRSVGDPFRFALAGLQPKLTLAEDDDRLTVPLQGDDGFWIAKFGSPGFQKLVANEFTMLAWAKSCGLPVPEHRIIPASAIENLPEEFEPDQDVLIVRRFDRLENGLRIHQEDFAQIFGMAPEDKYVNEAPDSIHYGSLGAVIHAVCGEEDYRDYFRRLVFMVLSGNADAHLKNWALVYPDGLRGRLAPVYDFIATVAYPSLHRYPALRWSEPVEPTADPGNPLASVTIDDLLIAASYTESNTSEIMDDISHFVRIVRESWPWVASTAPPIVRERVADHLAAAVLR